MKRHRIIGGEFELPINFHIKNKECGNQKRPEGFVTHSSGRAALYHILLSLEKRRILIPDYICHSVIETIELSGKEIEIYQILPNLQPNYDIIKNIYTPDDAILLINYFGLLDCSDIIGNLKKIDQGMIIIQDNVQSPFSMFQTENIDYSFTSFRKSFPTPDGAWTFSKRNNLAQIDSRPEFYRYKMAGAMLKSVDSTVELDDIYLELMEIGEKMIELDLNKDMSDFSKNILQNLDWDDIAERRIINAQFLVSNLHDLTALDIDSLAMGQPPLFIPILSEKRDKIRKELFRHNIFCPVHWPIESRKYKLERGEQMAREELSLIVDQRYNLEDMRAIIDIIQSI